MEFSIETLRDQLNTRGITVSPEEIEYLLPVFRLYFQDLETLRSLNLEDDESALIFDLQSGS